MATPVLSGCPDVEIDADYSTGRGAKRHRSFQNNLPDHSESDNPIQRPTSVERAAALKLIESMQSSSMCEKLLPNKGRKADPSLLALALALHFKQELGSGRAAAELFGLPKTNDARVWLQERLPQFFQLDSEAEQAAAAVFALRSKETVEEPPLEQPPPAPSATPAPKSRSFWTMEDVVPSRELRVLLGYQGCKAARAWLETQKDIMTVTEKEVPLIFNHLHLQASAAREAERISQRTSLLELRLVCDELRQAEQHIEDLDEDLEDERAETSYARDARDAAREDKATAWQDSLERMHLQRLQLEDMNRHLKGYKDIALDEYGYDPVYTDNEPSGCMW